MSEPHVTSMNILRLNLLSVWAPCSPSSVSHARASASMCVDCRAVLDPGNGLEIWILNASALDHQPNLVAKQRPIKDLIAVASFCWLSQPGGGNLTAGKTKNAYLVAQTETYVSYCIVLNQSCNYLTCTKYGIRPSHPIRFPQHLHSIKTLVQACGASSEHGIGPVPEFVGLKRMKKKKTPRGLRPASIRQPQTTPTEPTAPSRGRCWRRRRRGRTRSRPWNGRCRPRD